MPPTFRSFIAISIVSLIMPAVVSHAKPVSHKPKAKTTAAKPKADPNYTFIKQAYDYQSSGFPAKDANIIMAYTTADFVCISTSGVVETRDQYMQRAYQTFVQSQYINPIVTRAIAIRRATFTTYTASIEQSTTFSVTAQSPADPNKTVSATVRTIYYEDTWVRTATGWAEQKSVHL